MNLDTIREIARSNLDGRRPNPNREAGFIYYHGLRVANIAGELAARNGAARDALDHVLYTGALFHDVGKGFSGHNEIGAAVARLLLAEQFHPDELDEVCEIVRFHCVRKHQLDLPPRVLYVQDADIIDHYGAQHVWLQFLRAAQKGTTQTEAAEGGRRDSSGERLDRVRKLLNFDLSIEIFDQRVRYQREFYERFAQEALGGVFDGEAT